MIKRVVAAAIMYAVMGVALYAVNSMYQRTRKDAEAVKEGETVERYTVRIPMLGGVSLANAGMAAVILATNVMVRLTGGQMGDGMVQFCLIYGGLGLLGYALCHYWRLEVDGDSFTLHRFLRPARQGRFSEITRVREDRWHQLVCYSGQRKVVTVNLMNENRARFDASCARYGVDMSAISDAQDLIK